MEELKVPHHDHPLIPFTRFVLSRCEVCDSSSYIYGGYRCNEPGCQAVFHKVCAKPKLIHIYHPDHPLKLILQNFGSYCTLCAAGFTSGYCCILCDFKLDMKCARRPPPFVLPENVYIHEHPLKLSRGEQFDYLTLTKFGKNKDKFCVACDFTISSREYGYRCQQCKLVLHVDCVDAGTEAYHTSHPQHPLKSLKCEAPDYADKNCLLCAIEFDKQLHHCDVCNFSICRGCMENPPPVAVLSPTTHEHQLHLVPRRMEFTCNACGTQGDRSPYFCLLCNFMIHRECIDLPRVININRHVHRISYAHRLGHGKWKCKVCRKKVDGFYGGYTCTKCSCFVVHSRCATRDDIWDMVELEGTPEEPEEPAPFEVIDDNTIKHFSHDHNLAINKDGTILHENTLCEACVFQICSEPFYSCQQCDFTLHKKCANLPRKIRHVCHNQPFGLHTDRKVVYCMDEACRQHFTGFRYESDNHIILDVRCGSVSEPFVHESHPHPLYYSTDHSKSCSECGNNRSILFSCDECDYSLDFKCALLPKTVMRHRYDDLPLFLSYGDINVDGEYWCEACETKMDPKRWLYTCNDCGVVLHISCVVGDFSHIMPGTGLVLMSDDGEVVSNTSICRLFCYTCESRCKLPYILKISNAGVDVYICSYKCLNGYGPFPSISAQMQRLQRLQKKTEFISDGSTFEFVLLPKIPETIKDIPDNTRSDL